MKKMTKNRKRHPEMPDDSVSDITDVEKEEILTKYYFENMTRTDLLNHERKNVQNRLYGTGGFV